MKSPKVHLRDSGLLHTLLGIRGRESLDGHPKRGGWWEGFALEQVLQGLRLGTRRYGIEFKLADPPGTSRSMRIALEDLGPEHRRVVYRGTEEYALEERIVNGGRKCPVCGG